MSNGQSRVERYAHLTAREHMKALDNDLDVLDYGREVLVKTMEDLATARYEDISHKLFWVLTTFVSLILLVCGTLLAVVVRT